MPFSISFSRFVGVKRLELSTPCTPCKCASQLRHTPNKHSVWNEAAKIQYFLICVHTVSKFFCSEGSPFFRSFAFRL